MNRKEKNYKKNIIAKCIDLANGKFKDEEVESLYNLVEKIDLYNNKSRTIKNSFTDWSSEGKYTRNEETKYTIQKNGDFITVEEEYKYHDDDGQTGKSLISHKTGREIIRLIKLILSE